MPLPDNVGGLGPDNDDDDDHGGASETTPLIVSSSQTPRYDGETNQGAQTSPTPDPGPEPGSPITRGSPKRTTRWPSIIAVIVLTIACILIVFAGFIVPDRVSDYAAKALVIEPTNLSLEGIDENGVRARVQVNFRLDGSRVSDRLTRGIGRAVTSVVRGIATDQTTVSVYLSDFDGALAGTAALPPLAVSLVDGQPTQLDIVTALAAGNVDAISTISNLWLQGKLDQLRLVVKTHVSVRSGRISLGNHSVSEPIVIEGRDLYHSFSSLYFGEKTFF